MSEMLLTDADMDAVDLLDNRLGNLLLKCAVATIRDREQVAEDVTTKAIEYQAVLQQRIETLERLAVAASHYVQTFDGGEWSLGGGASEALGLLRTHEARREALRNAVKAWEAMTHR